MKKHILISILIVSIGIWGIKNLFGGTFYTSHDGYTHTARIAQYFQAIVDGQFPPRWAGGLNGGAGSPIFVFSYPLPYAAGSTLHFFGISFTGAFKLLVGGSFIFSGIGMYLFLKEFFDVRSAFVGSTFFMLAPYRFLNIYVRGSLSESVAFGILPFVFFAFTKIWKTGKTIWVICGAAAFSLFLLSQYLVAAMFLPLLLVFLSILFVLKKSVQFLRDSLLVFVLGFGLSAFVFVPVFFEKKYTHFSELIAYYDSHFVAFFQLIRSPWGYGFSLPGTVNDEMSFQIGLIHLLGIVLALLVFLYHLFLKKKDKLYTVLFLYALLFFGISIGLMLDTTFTKLVWQKISLLRTVDLPWRFLGISVFSSSIIVAFLLQKIRSFAFMVILLVLVIYANRNHVRVNLYMNYPDEEFIRYQGSATWLNEYTPIWRGTTKFDELKKRYTILQPELVVTEISSKSNQYIMSVEATQSANMRLNILYYPGWRIFVDEKEMVKDSGFYISGPEINANVEDKQSGFIDVKIPEGKHTVEARFTETSLRKMGNMISFVSLATLVFWGIYNSRKKINKQK